MRDSLFDADFHLEVSKMRPYIILPSPSAKIERPELYIDINKGDDEIYFFFCRPRLLEVFMIYRPLPYFATLAEQFLTSPLCHAKGRNGRAFRRQLSRYLGMVKNSRLARCSYLDDLMFSA